MNTWGTNPNEQQPAALQDFYQAWQNVINAIDQLQQAAGRAREYLDKIAPTLASAPNSWQILDRFLYFERLTVELGRIADDARRGTDEPTSGVK